jgi:ComF family protein
MNIFNILDTAIGIFAPHQCLGCGREGSLLCQACRRGVSPPQAVCYMCQIESAYGRTCRECRSATHSPLVSVNCVAEYEGLPKSLLRQLKFERSRIAANIIGNWLAEAYGSMIPSDALIVPVPTASSRVRMRGYDQAVLIARAVARRTDGEYKSLLRRYGAQEQKHASRSLRQTQLQGVFSVKKSADVVGKRILLIDDVLTTGATLNEAATLLRSQGARTIGAIVFARVP